MVKENLSITAVYQNAEHMILYAYYDGYLRGKNTIELVKKWIDLHEYSFTEKEMQDLTITEVKFSSLKRKIEFIERHKFAYDITCYRGHERLPMTGYERVIYEKVIDSWYDMYKTVVVAGQILPSVLFENEEMNQTMQELHVLSGKMYEKVDCYDSFLEFLSTTHVKRTLIVHPMSAIAEYNDEENQLELFRYQLFKDDLKNEESEVKE